MKLIALLWLPMTAIAAATALTFTLSQSTWVHQSRGAGPERTPVFAKTAAWADSESASPLAADAEGRMAMAPAPGSQVQR